MAAKICVNDEVIVLAGKDKNKIGKVKTIFSNGKSIITGINLIKKHQKPMPTLNKLGGILQKEAKIDISNIAIFNVITNKADRIGFKIENNKKKVRFLKSNGKIIN
ncbi:50S ribosomal protein L24 [Candidatus Mikella endobia]|uniref:Large ribosomal subunit protein uL24 n=1 Tax=Candidatus Mikella endobia TaxID=1778264 RepID=A0A143WPR5_9ENTR|nr:50S ribosomal protein L24 [Candidatus Mikella endobia]CUX95724.1 50S ribosomal protein L24 [Candidatus Mikella endobia]